ncbi:MAG: hypothetical protein M3Q31_04005 [Actinomycetota bacterium]|nr:hypothetical protein [Actinomycetota bacterium]
MEHPVVAVVLLALVARMLVAIASFVLTDGYLIPDEALYVDLGRAVVVHGLTPDQWYPGYGQSFYDSTRTFSGPLVFLFEVFGATRLVGQVFVAFVGTVAAGATVVIALRFLTPAFAALAGIVVALTPSEVLFSSVVLREAHVWLALTLLAGAALLLSSTDWRRVAGGFVLAAVSLLALAFLREQTMLAAAWALALAVIFTPRRLWVPRVAAGVAVAAFIPLLAGFGLAGWGLVTSTAPNLAETRGILAVGANSAFVPARPAPGRVTPSATRGGAASIAARAAAGGGGSVSASLEHLPTGLVDVTLRPFPWESSVGVTLLLARLETFLWYVLYALSLVGIAVSVRRRSARLALQFPVLVLGMLVGIAALTQGNLGTAFRHRDQVLYVLALCAAAGLQWLVRESQWARSRRRDTVSDRQSELNAPSIT